MGEATTTFERERDVILRRLGVIATPEISLPLDVGELSTLP